MEGLLRKILINELTLAGYKDAYVIPSKECVMLSPKSPIMAP
jgi:hypothetical protein